MKTSEAELLAKVIFEKSSVRVAGRKNLLSTNNTIKESEEKLRQAKRLFDAKYSLSTPPELMKL